MVNNYNEFRPDWNEKPSSFAWMFWQSVPKILGQTLFLPGFYLSSNDCNIFVVFFARDHDNSNRPVPIAEKPVPQAPAGEGCPRCGGHVYEAERMLAGGRVCSIVINFFIDLNVWIFPCWLILVMAQEVLQVQGLSQAFGFDQLLRSSRQRDLL